MGLRTPVSLSSPVFVFIRGNEMDITRLPPATLLLAVGAVLCAAELAGEHVCHKRETYTVTLRVVLKEPVQVRTYTWCLKVPPRCTKYKVELRDRLKVQTEVRERVVDVCCAGYAPDSAETQCLPLCSGCLHGVCATPDTCSCEPGYTGQRCDTECPEGLWGPACGLHCRCRNAATCNHISGDCKCADGWRGALCDVTCPKGTYGHACLDECDCQYGVSCHHVTGECGSSDEASSERRDSNPASTTASAVMKQTSGAGSGDSGEETTDVTPLLGHDNNSETDVWEPPARRPVIVVSDGLLSDRVDVEPASGVSDLVSSASVAGAVALALIVMAAVTVLVTHRRNRRAADPSLRHTFPDTDLRRADETPSCGGLQLSFGDVCGAVTTNSFGHPCNSCSNAKAYLELQYDIPPSCTSGNGQRPGMEPEHLYDEIPCWRSTTDRDTSRC